MVDKVFHKILQANTLCLTLKFSKLMGSKNMTGPYLILKIKAGTKVLQSSQTIKHLLFDKNMDYTLPFLKVVIYLIQTGEAVIIISSRRFIYHFLYYLFILDFTHLNQHNYQINTPPPSVLQYLIQFVNVSATSVKTPAGGRVLVHHSIIQGKLADLKVITNSLKT